MNKKLSKIFIELEEQMLKVESTKHTTHSESFGGKEYVDGEAFLEWKVKAKNLIVGSPEIELMKSIVNSTKP